GEDGKGFIYKTSDAGASWDLEWAGPLPKSSISELTVQPGERLWACGAHNTILRGPFMTNVSEENLPPQAIPNLVIYPNPFSSTVRINYRITKPGKVKLVLYDVLGQKVKTLIETKQEPGSHEVIWNSKNGSGKKVTPGIYFFRMETDEREITKKVSLYKSK
ncbi:MAG: T9SS type A sorting domain-containing protein, partial [candidate division WOR-3 bacterium]|nr:T9SS type A sorting domain-containing protein [candidate division WOR-3 bacterium]